VRQKKLISEKKIEVLLRGEGAMGHWVGVLVWIGSAHIKVSCIKRLVPSWWHYFLKVVETLGCGA
jgi:hypothetical protein